MKPTHQTSLLQRAPAGFVRSQWVVTTLLLLVTIVIALLLLKRSDSGESTNPIATQEQIDEQLGKLQQAFQTAMQEKQDLTRIVSQAKAFTEEHPGTQAGYVLLAQTRIGMEQWEQAYGALQKALELDAYAFELYKLAGVCSAKLGNMEQALWHYKQAVAATNDQADSDVYAALGQLHLALNEPDLAEQMFNRAAEAPGPGEDTNYKHKAYAGLAEVAAVRKQFDQSLGWIDRAIKMARLDSDADSAAYHIQKARLYMIAGQDEDAVTMLSFTWSQFPNAPWRIESARLRATLYEKAGELDTAVDYLQNLTEWHRLTETRDNKTLASFTALLARWQIKTNRVDAARISLHNLQTLAPKHPAIDELKTALH